MTTNYNTYPAAGSAARDSATGREAAPNVVLVLIDDLGYGTSSAFGGPCRMPAAERLAGDGLRYSRFHVTALCSPTRQALLTGRNHHSVEMGSITEMASNAPGYTSVRPPSAATLAQTLSANGYSTAAFGKWHQTPVAEVSPSGPFDRWPTGEGFDKFYGFMGAEMNHWYPLLYDGTTPVEPERTPEEGYHLSEDLVDHAIDWVRTQHAVTPDRPFLTYLAFGACHAPLHVSKEWRDKYRGQFDHGWDRQRELTLERQKVLGVVAADAELAAWPDEIPRWDDLSTDQKRVAARFMETFAAFAEHTDAQVARFVDELEALDVLDNTLFIYILGDNGASAEGGLEGSVVEFRLTEGIVDDLDEQLRLLDCIGDPDTYPIAPAGWAHAMNTPHPWSKQIASHLGGVRDGMIVHWPGGIRHQGEVRTQFHHVIDIVPTVLECVGVPAPASFQGVDQQPIEGVSMYYSFNDEHHPDARTTQYFEMLGNRGIYHEGWLASARHGIPWEMVTTDERPFADDVWELYNLAEDWSQANDLAASMPEKLRELQELFTIEAAKHNVFPLDDRISERTVPELAGRPDVTGDRTPVIYHGGVRRLGENVAPNVKNRSHRIEADVTVSADSGTGVIVAQGGRFGGWSLYLKEGVPTYAYNFFGIDMTYAVASERLTEGRHGITADFQYAGGGVGQAARVVLRIDGAVVAEAEIQRTVSFLFSFDETFDVGVDLASPVSPDYPAGDNAFPGTVHGVTIYREQAAALSQEREFESLLKVQ